MFQPLRPRRRQVLLIRLSRHSTQSLWAGLGGAIALLLILLTSSLFVHQPLATLLVASMGASAVLLFAAPSAPLSQPWNLLGGQVLSALVGVTCAQFVEQPWLSAALAVGISILLMGLLACTHPPGGATALSAVVGGPGISALGYQYVLTPVLLNSMIILGVALLFHRPTRTYPLRAKGAPRRRLLRSPGGALS